MKDRIVKVRTHYKLSQDEFSRKLGISRTSLSSIESGYRPIQERHIKLILAAFPQVSEKWLRTGEGQMMVPRSGGVSELVKKYSFADIVGKLLETYEDLDPESQAIVLDYTQRFVSSVLAGLSVDEAAASVDLPEIDIDEEVERYREQLIEQKMTESSPWHGTGSTDETESISQKLA